jgi:hypothetical protein
MCDADPAGCLLAADGFGLGHDVLVQRTPDRIGKGGDALHALVEVLAVHLSSCDWVRRLF